MDNSTALIVIPLVFFAAIYAGSAMWKRRAEKRRAEELTATLGEKQRMSATGSQAVGRSDRRDDAATLDESPTQRVGPLSWAAGSGSYGDGEAVRCEASAGTEADSCGESTVCSSAACD
jgi:hypothetical protein